jgi:hypothetical protein
MMVNQLDKANQGIGYDFVPSRRGSTSLTMTAGLHFVPLDL